VLGPGPWSTALLVLAVVVFVVGIVLMIRDVRSGALAKEPPLYDVHEDRVPAVGARAVRGGVLH
jgi:hypothetical protein